MTLESFTSIAYQWIFSSSCGPVWGSYDYFINKDAIIASTILGWHNTDRYQGCIYFQEPQTNLDLSKRQKRVRRSVKKQPSPLVATRGIGYGRRNEWHRTVPSGRTAKLAWEPPRGSWEHKPFHIDGYKGDSAETLMIYITWLGGHKTRHKVDMLCKKCPQKVTIS
ncbi:hypothetical protein NOF04DRAFT_1414796 [Fusarium oxysporum II5]|nr:hypothetical protein NOF04DRAFT_1414796 [Fusarium oxysporum II5]